MIGFIIWIIGGSLLIAMGIFCLNADQAVNPWANIKDSGDNIIDIKSYNRAMGKLWIVYGLIFIPLGLPLLAGQNSPWLILSILGLVFETIFLMVLIRKIEIKYRGQ